jgi:hypothetical protein
MSGYQFAHARRVTASFGIASLPEEVAATAENLLLAADGALAAAKRAEESRGRARRYRQGARQERGRRELNALGGSTLLRGGWKRDPAAQTNSFGTGCGEQALELRWL